MRWLQPDNITKTYFPYPGHTISVNVDLPTLSIKMKYVNYFPATQHHFPGNTIRLSQTLYTSLLGGRIHLIIREYMPSPRVIGRVGNNAPSSLSKFISAELRF